jgi:hypothetical protein
MDAAITFSEQDADGMRGAMFNHPLWLYVSFLFLVPIHLHAQYTTIEIEKVQCATVVQCRARALSYISDAVSLLQQSLLLPSDGNTLQRFCDQIALLSAPMSP